MKTALHISFGVAIGAIVAIAFIVARDARGPVGPESIVGMEVQDRVEEAAALANVLSSPAKVANPGLLKLPSGLESKRRVKRMFSTVGVLHPAPESAMEFTLHQKDGLQSLRCLVVLRGDHVIGVGIIYDGDDNPFTDRVRSALEMEFQGYEVQRLRPGA